MGRKHWAYRRDHEVGDAELPACDLVRNKKISTVDLHRLHSFQVQWHLYIQKQMAIDLRSRNSNLGLSSPKVGPRITRVQWIILRHDAVGSVTKVSKCTPLAGFWVSTITHYLGNIALNKTARAVILRLDFHSAQNGVQSRGDRVLELTDLRINIGIFVFQSFGKCECKMRLGT